HEKDWKNSVGDRGICIRGGAASLSNDIHETLIRSCFDKAESPKSWHPWRCPPWRQVHDVRRVTPNAAASGVWAERQRPVWATSSDRRTELDRHGPIRHPG